MNRLLISIVIFTVLSCFAASATPFEDTIKDDVEFFFTINSISEIREQWASHPMAKLFESGFLAECFEEAENSKNTNKRFSITFETELENAFGLSVDEFFELFSGQVSLAIYNLSDLITRKETRPELVLMAEFSGEAEQLDELMQKQFEHNAEKHEKTNPLIEHEMIKESFMEETLYFDEVFDGEKTYIEDGYALVDGILILATPMTRLHEAIELIKEDTHAPISKSDVYLRYREQTDASDFSLYLNLIELIPPLNATLLELPIFKSLSLFGVTAQSLESALSLESLQALYTDIGLVEDGLLLQYGVLFKEKLGLLSLINYADATLPEAPYVPKNILSSSISLFDLNATLAGLEKILGLASPALPSLIDIQTQAFQTNMGVDIRTSILENFGPQIVNFSILDKDTTQFVQPLQQQQFFAIDLKDAQAFRNAVNALKDSSPAKSLIEEQTYEGETIYSLTQPGTSDTPEMQFNYAVTRSKLLITVGHVDLLHEVLSAMTNDREGFWQDPQTKSLFERIERPNPVARNFVDIEQFVAPFCKLLAEGEPNQLPAFMQAVEIPEELKEQYRLISEVNEETGSIFGRTLLIKIKENE